MFVSLNITETKTNTTMNNLNMTHTFSNGNTVSLFSKSTKTGLKYFYWSFSCMRYFPISKKEIGIL